ncbi:hypothetical protein NQ314_014225 [Rhamnusium bicolor]|uniref:DDE Tnp4 domain-containing protein n=1 Tax=Rhamnusium bicolor TaxID=1586634 RepID=A0AAV8X547_9CUCU|nr:hypothetical protein NQ314_014225 [Rhamnusium bicolor]
MDDQEILLIHQIFEDLIQAEKDAQAPKRQIYNNRIDPFVAMPDEQFIGLFGVDKVLAQEIIDMVTPYIEQGQTYSSLEIKTKQLFGQMRMSVNRKQYHSLNVQLICDENLKIMNVVARFPGSAHDAHIWRQCNMAQVMETIYRENNQNLFFPVGRFRNTIPGTPEDRFNNQLKSIRRIIERCNGVLKNRWRCLLKHRVLHYSPEKAAHIVIACCMLHNMCTFRNIPPLDVDDEMEPDYGININAEAENPNENVNEDLLAARQLQQQIINNYFNN